MIHLTRHHHPDSLQYKNTAKDAHTLPKVRFSFKENQVFLGGKTGSLWRKTRFSRETHEKPSCRGNLMKNKSFAMWLRWSSNITLHVKRHVIILHAQRHHHNFTSQETSSCYISQDIILISFIRKKHRKRRLHLSKKQISFAKKQVFLAINQVFLAINQVFAGTS